MITAKVVLRTKDVYSATGTGETALTFYPDYADGRNKEWAAATPALSLMMTVRGDVAAQFEQGGAYTLTFEPEQPSS